MSSKHLYLATALVALAVVLAGCGGGGGTATAGSDGGADDGAGPAVDTAEETTRPASEGTPATEPTQTPTATLTPTATATPAPTATPAEPNLFLREHEAALGDQEGYEARFVVNASTSDGRWTNMSSTLTVDLTTDERLQRTTLRLETGRSVVWELYRPPDSSTVYTCTRFQGECLRQQTVDEDGAANRTFYNVSAPAGSAGTAESPTFREAGTVQTDDGPRERYVVDDPAQLGLNASRYESVSIEVLVDPDTDLITSYRFEGTMDAESGTRTTIYELTFERYGSVSIEAPDWYDD